MTSLRVLFFWHTFQNAEMFSLMLCTTTNHGTTFTSEKLDPAKVWYFYLKNFNKCLFIFNWSTFPSLLIFLNTFWLLLWGQNKVNASINYLLNYSYCQSACGNLRGNKNNRADVIKHMDLFSSASLCLFNSVTTPFVQLNTPAHTANLEHKHAFQSMAQPSVHHTLTGSVCYTLTTSPHPNWFA